MKFLSMLFCKRRLVGYYLKVSLLLTMFAEIILLLSCLHDTSLPLQNDAPDLFGAKVSIIDTLYYPDSTIDDSIAIIDLNDSVITFTSVFVQESIAVKCTNTTQCDTTQFTVYENRVWPGNITILEPTLDVKRFVFTFAGTRMATYMGVLTAHDKAGGRVDIPFNIVKTFIDPLDNLVDLNARWNLYQGENENVKIRMNNDKKLMFDFTQKVTSGSLDTVYELHAVSTFRIGADFSTSIDFELRNDMLNRFEVAFYVSTSANVSRWVGSRAGIYLTAGDINRVRAAGKQGVTQSSQEIDFYEGVLQIKRTKNQIQFACINPNESAASVIFDENFESNSTDTLFVHLQMQVDDLSVNRHCTWNNFRVIYGDLVP